MHLCTHARGNIVRKLSDRWLQKYLQYVPLCTRNILNTRCFATLGVIATTRQALQATTSKVPLSARFAQLRGGASARNKQAPHTVLKQQRGQKAQKMVTNGKATRAAEFDVKRVQQQMATMSKQIQQLRQQNQAIRTANGNTGGGGMAYFHRHWLQ